MRRKNKNFYIVLIILVLFGVSIGYAAINKNLNITGNSEIKQNTWNLHFKNVKVTNGSVEATKEPTLNDTNLSIDFSFVLNLPGDFYEFTVDVVNEGTIDAMLDSISKTPTLTASQAKYLNYIVEYQNGEQISSKQLVKANEAVRLKMRVEYRTDLTENDLPTITDTLNLGFTVNYVQADGTGSSVKDNGAWVIKANGALDDIGTIVTIGSEQFYTIGTEGDNVKLLSMYNLYVGGEYDSDTRVWTPYGDKATGLQNEDMIGLNSETNINKGVTAYSNVVSTYSDSLVKGYVDDYEFKLEAEFGINIDEARLITKDELVSKELGCERDIYTCKNALSFIYSTSYWTGTSDETGIAWYVNKYGSFIPGTYSIDYEFGVRPVIVIPKTEIKDKLIKFVIGGTIYLAKNGMTWMEWVESEYNTDNYYVSDDRVTLGDLREVCTDLYHWETPDKLIIENYSYIIDSIPA